MPPQYKHFLLRVGKTTHKKGYPKRHFDPCPNAASSVIVTVSRKCGPDDRSER